MQPALVVEPDMLAQRQLTTAIYYPETDGEPVGETDFHISVIFYLRQALRYFFRNTPELYVAANMLFYYVEGNPRIYKVPDVFVVKGVAKDERRIYKLWEEGASPCVIFEITSPSTRNEDTSSKRQLYQSLGVREYFLFDPLNEYLRPRFQGFRLAHNRYEPILPGADYSMLSQELGLLLRPEDRLLRVVDPTTGQLVPSLEEAAEIAEEMIQMVQEVTTWAETESRRAEAETQRAETEAQRAETEAQRANAAEAELARLRTELEILKRQNAGQ